MVKVGRVGREILQALEEFGGKDVTAREVWEALERRITLPSVKAFLHGLGTKGVIKYSPGSPSPWTWVYRLLFLVIALSLIFAEGAIWQKILTFVFAMFIYIALWGAESALRSPDKWRIPENVTELLERKGWFKQR